MHNIFSRFFTGYTGKEWANPIQMGKETENEPPHDKTTKWLRPAKTQICLGIRPVWSESSLRAQWVPKDQSFLHVDSEDSDQTGRMPRLIWLSHFVGFVMRQLKSSLNHIQVSKIKIIPITIYMFYCCCLFWFNITLNNFSVISRQWLVVLGSSMLTEVSCPRHLACYHTKSHYPETGSTSPSSTP